MKLLLQKTDCRSRLILKNELDCKYEQVMGVIPIPYGINSTEEQEVCNQLNYRGVRRINWQINLSVKLSAVKALDEKPVDGKLQGDTLDETTKSEADQNYKVQMELTPYICSDDDGKDDSISPFEMFRTNYPGSSFVLHLVRVDTFADVSFREVFNAREMRVGTSLSCQHEAVISVGTAKSLLVALRSGVFESALAISMKLAVPISSTHVTDTFFAIKRILHEELSSDTIIKAGNGAEVKCLKGFLMAQSDVLQAMFENGKEESKTGSVNMNDLSEKGVRAFLKYLYYWDVADAREDIDIAWELLYAADKYNVKNLEVSMVELLTDKGDDFFTPELSLKIFLLIRDKKYSEANDLKMKTIHFLKKNIGEFEKTTEFKELLRKDTVAVNDLMRNFCL